MECLVLFIFLPVVQRTLGLSCAANFIFFNVSFFPISFSKVSTVALGFTVEQCIQALVERYLEGLVLLPRLACFV